MLGITHKHQRWSFVFLSLASYLPKSMHDSSLAPGGWETLGTRLDSFQIGDEHIIGHFRITFSLFLKARLGAHLFIWKWDFIHM